MIRFEFTFLLAVALFIGSCKDDSTITPTPKPNYLSDLEPEVATVGYGIFSIGEYEFTSAMDNISKGDTIVFHGVEYPHGLYAHAPSHVVYKLNEDFSELRVTIGLVEWISCGDGAQFIILLDGIEIYRSPIMFASSAPLDIKVDIDGGQNLELITDEGAANDRDCDWTIWGDPILK